MVRPSTIVIAALPLVLFAWTVIGLLVPELGMHDGDA